MHNNDSYYFFFSWLYQNATMVTVESTNENTTSIHYYTNDKLYQVAM